MLRPKSPAPLVLENRTTAAVPLPPLHLCFNVSKIPSLPCRRRRGEGMADNPFLPIFQAYESISRCVQTHLTRLFLPPQASSHHLNSLSKETNQHPLFSLFPKPTSAVDQEIAVFGGRKEAAGPLTKEELGRATWTLLHTIAAQYPDKPTRQQKRDAKELMAIMSRLYPCKECADHFKEVLIANPVQAGSQEEFSQWLCHVHNVVNRSLGKLTFPCNRVNARWGKLDCPERSCDLQGTPDMSTQNQ